MHFYKKVCGKVSAMRREKAKEERKSVKEERKAVKEGRGEPGCIQNSVCCSFHRSLSFLYLSPFLVLHSPVCLLSRSIQHLAQAYHDHKEVESISHLRTHAAASPTPSAPLTKGLLGWNSCLLSSAPTFLPLLLPQHCLSPSTLPFLSSPLPFF